MRVLILGVSGMLGHKLYQHLAPRFPETFGTLRGRIGDTAFRHVPAARRGRVFEQINAMEFARLRQLLNDVRPDVTLNCIGIIKQRPEAVQPISSITINSLLPHQLAGTINEIGGRLIHFSTDCVFSGRRGNYGEEDCSDAEDLYGRTKYLGEVRADHVVTLRTSMIGRELTHQLSLLEWFLSQIGRTIHGYSRVIYSGTTTNHLAGLVGEIIERFPRLSGLFHVATSPLSKYQLLCLLRDSLGLNVEIIPDGTVLCDRSLNGSKLSSALGYAAPSWRELIEELVHDPTPYNAWRSV